MPLEWPIILSEWYLNWVCFKDLKIFSKKKSKVWYIKQILFLKFGDFYCNLNFVLIFYVLCITQKIKYLVYTYKLCNQMNPSFTTTTLFLYKTNAYHFLIFSVIYWNKFKILYIFVVFLYLSIKNFEGSWLNNMYNFITHLKCFKLF